jgi:hypothetical protein
VNDMMLSPPRWGQVGVGVTWCGADGRRPETIAKGQGSE